ncbi:2Fe-2S iron-sulfur cluster-binding protein [Alkalimonas sp. NCh-2]|uniref:2Fe-2S iron-sulfur cluster-binding protein n=1 Tax=Alkalimonas sp. NCh-2 TaxID=3144846 RepID=UPI0031F5F911
MITEALLWLLLLFSVAALLVLLYWTLHGLACWLPRIWQGLQKQPLRLQVVSRQDVSDDLFLLQLKAAGWRRYTGSLPAFRPGQYLTLLLPAAQQAQLKRAYSLAAWQARPFSYQLGIKREPGGRGSGWLHAEVQPGVRLLAQRPQGHFVLRHAEQPVVLLAGGIGITPLRAMLHRLQRLTRPPRTLLCYGARNQRSLLYWQEFELLTKTTDWFEFYPLLSQPDACWHGLTGRLSASQVLAWLGEDAQQAHYYCCASNAMMDEIFQGLTAAGIPGERLHREAFAVAANLDQQPYPVSVQGHTYEFSGQSSLLHALEAWNLPVEGDCRAGDCGLCAMRLQQGQVRWLLPDVAAKVPPQQILCCCTVPASPIALAFCSGSPGGNG